MMAPGLRSRFGQPSSRLPIPLANESSTVEWQMAQVIPTRVNVSCPPTDSTVPTTPTTAFSFSSAKRGRGAGQTDRLILDPGHHLGGQCLRVHLQAHRERGRGVDRRLDDLFIFSVSVQNVSSPKVSKRKMSLP